MQLTRYNTFNKLEHNIVIFGANIFLTGTEHQDKMNKFVSHQSELYSILYKLCNIGYVYALKQTSLLLCCYSTCGMSAI